MICVNLSFRNSSLFKKLHVLRKKCYTDFFSFAIFNFWVYPVYCIYRDSSWKLCSEDLRDCEPLNNDDTVTWTTGCYEYILYNINNTQD